MPRTVNIAALAALTAWILLVAWGLAFSQPPPGSDPLVTGYAVVVETPLDPETATVRIGQTIAIAGQNFGVEPGMIQLGCIDIVPLSWSPTRITFTVPVMAPSARPEQLTVFCSSPRLYYRTQAFRVAQ